MTDLTPTEFGPYQPEQLIARGAHAQVWFAKGPSGPVALKVSTGERYRAALLREAELLQLADHANIVRVLDYDREGEWIAQSLVDGIPLDRWAEGRSVGDVCGIVTQLTSALQHLHSKGIVHGDLKPANILVDVDDQVTLIDLGIATMSSEERRGFKGTLGFAAPELLHGARPNIRTDVYGLGAAIYAALVGEPPFTAPDPAALTYIPLVSLPPPPSAFRTDCPVSLERLLLTLLARDPARRPARVDKLGMLFARAAVTPVGMPVVGMHEEREELRRAVVGASDRECRVVVVYGPAGSGRHTLIDEATQAAVREGLRLITEKHPQRVATNMNQHKGTVPVVVLRDADEGVIPLCAQLLEKRVPGLFMVISHTPLPSLGSRAVHVTPPPLTRSDIEVLCAFHGNDKLDAEAIRASTLGLPAPVVARIDALLRGTLPTHTQHLPEASRLILQSLRDLGELQLPDLARAVALSEHAVLDWCEVLFAEGLVEDTQNGTALRALS